MNIKSVLTAEEQLNQICFNCVDIVSKTELLKKINKSIKTSTPLKIKAGFDPSRPDLHLGHVVLLKKLKVFQNLGHKIIVVIGDFTACIGDPSGYDKTRPVLDKITIEKNAQTYFDQVFKVLDKDKTTIVYNSSWMKKMSSYDFIHLSSKYTVARMLEREDFSKRFKKQQSISLHEFLYPLVQGYDSVVLESDVELGGTDQLFNLLMGRELQKKEEKEPQCVLTMPLLEGLDGVKKMSKSYDNYIAITDSPRDIFGKTMKLSDELMIRYYSLLSDKTFKEMQDLKKKHPMQAKMELAYFFVSVFYNIDVAKQETQYFKNVFSKQKIPKDIEQYLIPVEKNIGICSLIQEVGFAASTSSARRLIEGHAVKWDGEKITDPKFIIKIKSGQEFLLKVGKRKFIKIRSEKNES